MSPVRASRWYHVVFALSFVMWGLETALTATPAPAAPPPAAPTFTKDIAPILFENCSSCHRPGGGAPFDLLTYDDAREQPEVPQARLPDRGPVGVGVHVDDVGPDGHVDGGRDAGAGSRREDARSGEG